MTDDQSATAAAQLHREQLKILELFGTIDPADMMTDEEMQAQGKGRVWTEEERAILYQSVKEHPLTATDPRRQLLVEALAGSLVKTGDAVGRDLTQELLDDRRKEARKKGW